MSLSPVQSKRGTGHDGAHDGHAVIEVTELVTQHLVHRCVAFHPADGVPSPRLAGCEHEHPPPGIGHHQVLAPVALLLSGVILTLPLGALRPLDGALHAIKHHVFNLG